MKAIYTANKSSSFYKNERKRIIQLIDESLLELVLRYLPHHQPTEEDRMATWEMVAIDLNNRQWSKALESQEGHALEELPTLNGLYVQEIYNKRQEAFNKKFLFQSQQLVYEFTAKTDLILNELRQMSGVGVKLLASISKENLENRLRTKYFPTGKEEAQSEDGEKHNADYKDSLALLEEHKESLQKLKLEEFEQELTRTKNKLSQIERENKKLLELNHELLLELQELRRS